MNIFDLVASLKLDTSDYSKRLNDAEKQGGGFGSGLAKAAKMGAKVVAGAAAAAASGIAVITKQSVSSYGEYQQLVGGVQKLYGNMGMSLEEYAENQGKTTDEVKADWEKLQEAQDLVLKNSKNAYRTAGMSANEYMETATQFSASLINSLGGDTVAAAEMTDKAMVAMSDNFNTFGGNFESISDAFKGFSKQNYTMLDNLKLGYGGTKTEMERLIADANEYAASIGQASDLSIDSFADIVTAIDLIQKKQNIAGTTARESSTTIEGSFKTLQGAWENLLTSIGSGEGLDESINNLMDAIVGYTDETGKHVNGFLDNLLPTIETSLSGIGTLISKIAPIINEMLPTLVDEVLPSVITATMTLLQGLIAALPDILNVLLGYLPEMLTTIINAIVDILPELVTVAIEAITTLAQGLTDALPDLIPVIVDVILTIVETLLDNLDLLIDASVELIIALTVGIINALPILIERAPEIIAKLVTALIDAKLQLFEAALVLLATLGQGLIDNVPELIKQAIKLPGYIVDAIKEKFPDIKQLGKDIIDSIKDGLGDYVSDALEWGSDLIDNFVDGIKGGMDKVKDGVKGIGKTIKNHIGFSEPEEGPLSNFHTYAPDMIDLFVKGINDGQSKLKNAMISTGDIISSGMTEVAPIETRTSGNAEIIKAIEELKNTIASQQIVLDSGALVGGISEQMDNSLGRRQSMAMRGVIA
jgi:phage-related protein